MMRRFQIAAVGLAVSVLTVLGDRVVPIDTISVGVSFSKDGQSLAVLGDDRKVRVWDRATGRLSPGHESAPDMAFCSLLASGNQFVTVATNGTVQFRDTGSGRILTTCELPTSLFVRAMASTADGAVIAASSGDPAIPSGNLVHVLDRSGRTRFRAPAGVGGVASMAFSPDGVLLAAAPYDADIRVWEVRTGTLQHVIEDLKVATFDLAYSPDGKYLATAGADRTIYLWETKSWKLERKITGQPETIYPIRFSPDGSMMVTGGMNERNFNAPVKVILWDFASGRQIRAWTAEHAVQGLSFSPDGTEVAVADGTKRVMLLAVPNKRTDTKR